MVFVFFLLLQNGLYLDSCILLGSNSSYSASEKDNVFLEAEIGTSSLHSSGEIINDAAAQNVAANRPTELIFELQVWHDLPCFLLIINVDISSLICFLT